MSAEMEAYNKYEYWLAGIVSLPGRKKIYLKSLFGEAERIYQASERELEQISILTECEKEGIRSAKKKTDEELERELMYCRQKEIMLAVWQHNAYPTRLEHIYNPPYGLFYRGKLPDGGQKFVSILGARKCTCYGKAVAQQIGKGLAAADILVVSGMAAGIDGAAQRGALCGGGSTLGVLGCGVDVCYPAANRELYERLITNGCVVSEYPPRTRPLALNFPQRNRIISGLADVILVVEARERSGSLITVDFALEQGKDIYAVPGRISDLSSGGTNRLIQQGAGIYLNMENFLESMHIFSKTEENSCKKQKLALENLERLVYSCLDLTPRNLESLWAETGLDLEGLMETLGTLQEMGIVSEVYKNYYIRSDTD